MLRKVCGLTKAGAGRGMAALGKVCGPIEVQQGRIEWQTQEQGV